MSVKTINKYPSKHANHSLPQSFLPIFADMAIIVIGSYDGWCFMVNNLSYICAKALAIKKYIDNGSMHR